MRIAVIAPGVMGAAVAQRLHARGAVVAVTLAGRGSASAGRAAGLMRLDSEAALVAWAELVLSILPPGQALALAQRLAPALRARGSAVTYADCNAVSPPMVRRIEAELAGVRFVDIGIFGGPPKGDDAGPRFYASGDATPSLLKLCDFGIDLYPIEGGIGAASALKMSFAGISKGFTALGSAMALGATRAGVAAHFHAELASREPEILRYLTFMVPGMFDKAYRWVAEMQEIGAFLGDGPSAPIYQAIARLYEAIARDYAAPAPDGEIAELTGFFTKRSQSE